MKPNLSRRDFIKITAISGGALVGGKVLSDLLGKEFVTIMESRVLMGTVINLAVIAESRSSGNQAVADTFAELERLVAIFDYRDPDSTISLLNHHGKILNPPVEFTEVLEKAFDNSELTNGAFDVTIKPLLDLYHSNVDLPSEAQIQETLLLVGYRKVAIESGLVSFHQPGMAITLDGIAKGFIVDQGIGVLEKSGFKNVLVEAGGDLMGLGKNESLDPWKIGLQAPRGEIGSLMATIHLQNRALATSGDYLNAFTPDFLNHHILDPQSGHSPPELAGVSVMAATAALADALATSVMVMGKVGLELIEKLPICEALAVTKDSGVLKTSGFTAS